MPLGSRLGATGLQKGQADVAYVNHGTDGEGTEDLNYIALDTSYTPTGSEPVGTTHWNSADGTFNDVLPGGVVGQRFQEQFFDAKNRTGVDVADGKPVMFAAPVGVSGKVEFQLAIADGSIPSQYIMGITTESIANGEFGKVTWFGKVRGIDTTGTPYGEVWANGDLIYVGLTAGALTNVKPNVPNQIILVATVIITHAVNGVLLLRPSWNPKLTELDDVNGTPLTTNGQILVWDNDNSYFDFTANINDYALTTALHSAVTVTDSAEIDFTLTGQNITASIIAGSIDETKLDISTNASLDLADSAIQTETDPVVGAITGIVKANGVGVISAAVADTDYLTPGTASSTYQPLDADLTTIAGLSSADSNFIVGSATGWVVESGATARTSLGVDPAGTDNSTNVTLAGTPDYLTIAGQVITLGQIDLTTDVTGVLPTGNIADAYVLNTGDISTGTQQINVATTTSEALILKTTDNNTTKNLFEIQNSSASNLIEISAVGKMTFTGIAMADSQVLTVGSRFQPTGVLFPVQFVPVFEPATAGIVALYGSVNAIVLEESTNNVTTAIGSQYQVSLKTNYTGTLTNAYALNIITPGKTEATASITNNIGINIQNQTTGSTLNIGLKSAVASATGSYNIYASGTADNYFAGNVGIGETSPLTALHISGSTSPALRISEAGSTTSYFEFADTDVTRATIEKTNPSGGVVIDIDPKPGDGTSSSNFRFFRLVSTSGRAAFDVYKADATATINSSFSGNGNTYLNANNGDVIVGSTTSRSAFTVNGTITPLSDNLYDLGTVSFRWDDVYATNGTIQTSDANKKDNIADSDLGLDFINSLRPVKYKWKNYTGVETQKEVIGEDELGNPLEIDSLVETEYTFTRTHYGLIAQEVKAQLDILGKDFAGYIENENTKGLRYNEFIGPVIKSIQELHSIIELQQVTISDLTTRLEALEGI